MCTGLRYPAFDSDVIFDPYRHFTCLNENNIDHVTHMFQIYRGIAAVLKAGVIVVHHHRKIADSIFSIYRSILPDNTRRFKLVFDTRQAEPFEPLEPFRQGGANAMLWIAEEWVDHTRAGEVFGDEQGLQCNRAGWRRGVVHGCIQARRD